MSDLPDDEHLPRQLCQLEENPDAIVDSTVRALHRELETLAEELRQPKVADQHEAEAGCQQSIQQAQALPIQATLSGDPSSFISAESPFKQGTSVSQYKLVARLGRGGMGVVYKALHVHLGKVVALKLMTADRMRIPLAVARFHREMKAVGRLEHPNLVRAFDAGEVDGAPFLVMEYVDGMDLSTLEKEQGPLSIADACELIRQAATGLHVAHQSDLIHRDVKPANLMLARQEHGPPIVKVLDLGLALDKAENVDQQSGLTSEGQIMGTIDYLAPEQAENSHTVTAAVDVYSLGATLFSLLTGRAPYQASRFQSLYQKVRALAVEPIPSIQQERSDVPDELAAVLNRMLARDPANRFSSAREVAEALASFTAEADLEKLLGLPASEGNASTNATQIQHSRRTELDLERQREALTTTVALEQPPAQKADLESPPVPAPMPSRRGFRIAALLVLITLAPFLWFFGGTIIRFATNEGELILEVEDKSVAVTLSLNGVVIDDPMQNRRYVLKAGKGQIEVREKDGINLTTKKFELTRGGKTIVRVTMNDVLAARRAKANRRAAEYVLSLGGSVQVNEHPRNINKIADLPKKSFQLTQVDLSDNQKLTDEGIAIFRQCTHLTRADFSNTPITGSGLGAFANRTKLITLLLSSTKVSDEDMKHFRRCTNLSYLQLQGTQVTDAGLAAFRNCKNLVDLRLSGEKITNRGVAHFRDCHRLEWLVLYGTNVSDTGLAVLARCKNLIKLDLSYTKVTDKGLIHFRDCPRLVDLRLEGTAITDQGLAMFKDCPNLTHLSLAYLKAGDKGLEHFRQCRNLKYLDLSETRVTDQGLAAFAECRNLQTVLLQNTDLTNNGVAHLKNCKHLTHLNLGSPELTDTSLTYFTDCRDLIHLQISGNKKMTNQGLAEFGRCRNLQWLILDNTNVSDAGLMHFRKCEQLYHVDLSGTGTTDKGLKNFGTCQQLTSIHLWKTKVTAKGVLAIQKALPRCAIKWSAR